MSFTEGNGAGCDDNTHSHSLMNGGTPAVHETDSTSIYPDPSSRLDDAKTPTNATFQSNGQQGQFQNLDDPGPTPPPDHEDTRRALKRNSQYSNSSPDPEDMEIDTGGNSPEDNNEGQDSDMDSTQGVRTKKKKQQRFYCTEYPPCSLSFTRSEHLARHIRKHTGERPFQCHCSRRFSRLDNLRQHAQTVHVNEDIPADSPAATGTRFQRQIRTDRVRAPGASRNRANTAGASVLGGRGHTRNSLSTSSIGSIASIYGARDDLRRRPPPLVMASGPRDYGIDPQQPSSGFSTPTSSRFSTGYDSPHMDQWGSSYGSPGPSHSRTNSMYSESSTPGRRLSVPSGNPYPPPPYGNVSVPYGQAWVPGPMDFAQSPTSSMASGWSRRDSYISGSNPYDDRRRTWHHPEAYQMPTHRLQHVTSIGEYPQPPSTSNGQITLPGIESFDPLPPRPSTPSRSSFGDMVVDTPSRSQIRGPDPFRPTERPGSGHWESNLPSNFNRLDLAYRQEAAPTDDASRWASDAERAVQERAYHAQAESNSMGYNNIVPPPRHPNHISAPPITPRGAKRQAWYGGPLIDPRLRNPTSTDSSASDSNVPATPHNGAAPDPNPVIQDGETRPQQSDGGNEQGMNRLDALVMVATANTEPDKTAPAF